MQQMTRPQFPTGVLEAHQASGHLFARFTPKAAGDCWHYNPQGGTTKYKTNYYPTTLLPTAYYST